MLVSLFSRFRRQPRGGRKTRGRTFSFVRTAAVEQLEERRLLVSRVFLDFGDSFTAPTSGPYAGFNTALSLTPATIHTALVGAGKAGDVVYNEGVGLLEPGLTVTPPYNLVGTGGLLNSVLNSTVVPTDFLTLEESITEQIQLALEPFDIQVISSVNTNFGNFPFITAGSLAPASALEALNNYAGDGGSPVNGTATTPQYGSDDVYLIFAGVFQTFNNIAVPSLIPISDDFAVQSPNTPGAKPDRMDSGAIIDTNYWISRVLGSGGTGGSLNVAMANAALYAIGWDYGVSEVDSGAGGPFTNFTDPNVTLLNQSNAMVEGGFFETTYGLPTISAQNSAYFNNFPMMQDGEYLQPLLQPGVLGQSAIEGVPTFPLPPGDTSFSLLQDGVFIEALVPVGDSQFTFPDATMNTDPSNTVNSYQQLANDPDIGPNPDIAYVSGTGGFDQIYITKINSTQAQVTVNAYTDDTYTTLISDASAADGDPGVISSYSYDINLAKTVIPGRLNDNQPFKIVVDGTTSDDQIYLDPTLGVTVEVHGGADAKILNITGNGAYNVQYTPNAPPSSSAQNVIAQAASLIPEGLIPGAAGTLLITGTATTTVTTTVGKKTTTKNVTAPFTTTVLLNHFNPGLDLLGNDSALRLENFNKLTYKSPGFLNNEYSVSSLLDGSWQISGQVDSSVNPPAQNGNLQFNNVKQLVIDTTSGASNDTVSFATGDSLPQGLQNVDVLLGSGINELDFDDSLNADGSENLNDQNYLISSAPNTTTSKGNGQLLPVQPGNSVFTGFNYSGVEVLSLNGTDGQNAFTVTPSVTTAYVIDGEDPPDGTPPEQGDSLAVHTAGTQGAFETDDGAGNGEWFFSNRQTVTFSDIENIVNPNLVTAYSVQPNPLGPGHVPQDGIIAVAGSSDAGVSKPLVKVYDAITNQLLYQFYAYDPSFKGGVRVTTADVNGDGLPDIIVAPGPGTVPGGQTGEVKVFDGSALFNDPAKTTQEFIPFPASELDVVNFFQPDGPKYANGLNVAVGDVDGDGNPDIITSESKGASNIVVALHDPDPTIPSFTPTIAFTGAYPKTMTAGTVIAVGDIDGDGIDEIVTAPGVGQAALVKIFDFDSGSQTIDSTPLRQFYGFETTFRGGVSLTMGDVDGDGLAEIILGAGTGGKSRVRVFNAATGTLEREFQAFTTGNINAPVKVYAADIDESGVAELFTAQALSATTHPIDLYDPLATVNPLATPLTAPLVDTLLETSPDLRAGINLG
jgi:hypothetical protein